jgi:hypothetical protein
LGNFRIGDNPGRTEHVVQNEHYNSSEPILTLPIDEEGAASNLSSAVNVRREICGHSWYSSEFGVSGSLVQQAPSQS